MIVALKALIILGVVQSGLSLGVFGSNRYVGALNRVLNGIDPAQHSNLLKGSHDVEQPQPMYFENLLDHFGRVAKSQGKDPQSKWMQVSQSVLKDSKSCDALFNTDALFN